MVVTSYFDFLVSRVVEVCIVLSFLFFAIAHDGIPRLSTSLIDLVAIVELSLLQKLIEIHFDIMCINLLK